MSAAAGVRPSDRPLVAATPCLASADATLRVEGVGVRFGGIRALDGISFAVAPGTICGIIGPNGAGKTTLFNCLSGLYRPSEGRIIYRDRVLADVPVHRIAALGIGRTFQNLALFRTMDVKRTVAIGTHGRTAGGFLSEAFALPAARRAEAEAEAHVAELPRMLDLWDVADTPVSHLPFATLKRVELARALASRPSLLLPDEPAAGLSHEGVEALLALILRIRANLGVAILLVEHHMNLVMRVSDQVVALNFGRKIADGLPEEVRANPEVVEAYLGNEP